MRPLHLFPNRVSLFPSGACGPPSYLFPRDARDVLAEATTPKGPANVASRPATGNDVDLCALVVTDDPHRGALMIRSTSTLSPARVRVIDRDHLASLLVIMHRSVSTSDHL